MVQIIKIKNIEEKSVEINSVIAWTFNESIDNIIKEIKNDYGIWKIKTNNGKYDKYLVITKNKIYKTNCYAMAKSVYNINK